VVFNFITLFPEIVEGYFGDSILQRAIEEEKITVNFVDPRDFTEDKHNRVDSAPIGGGAGMVMTPQPLSDAIESVGDSHIIALTPVAKRFNQKDAIRLAQKKSITFVSGRYEGIDERVIEKSVDELFSIGDFILTGGELASLILCDAISRNIDGVLGNRQSLEGESFGNGLLEAPNFSKPNSYKGAEVPEVFLGGNHRKIEQLKESMATRKTQFFRPDLLKKYKTEQRS
jgi:tRNA (guanine37-N1)-methyltransferase